jgi:hypothetical protein
VHCTLQVRVLSVLLLQLPAFIAGALLHFGTASHYSARHVFTLQLKDQFFGEVLTSADSTDGESASATAAAAAAAAVSAHRTDGNIAGARARLSPNPQLQVRVATQGITRGFGPSARKLVPTRMHICATVSLLSALVPLSRALHGHAARCPLALCFAREASPLLPAPVRSAVLLPRPSASCAGSLRCRVSHD